MTLSPTRAHGGGSRPVGDIPVHQAGLSAALAPSRTAAHDRRGELLQLDPLRLRELGGLHQHPVEGLRMRGELRTVQVTRVEAVLRFLLRRGGACLRRWRMRSTRLGVAGTP